LIVLAFYGILLTPKGLGVVFIKRASKQPLFKARWIVQTWGFFEYF
jgi:hypothetical protein